MILTILATFQGCKGGGQIEPVTPESEPLLIDTTIIVPATAAVNRFGILSHSGWKAVVTSGASWCHVTPTDGGSGGATIAVKTDDNDEFEVRQAKVEIHNATTVGYINVIQQQIDVLDVTTDGVCDFGPQGGTFGVNVGYNIEYTISCSASWVRQTQTKALQRATLMFEVDKNNSGGPRECDVLFAGDGISHTITVSQEAAYMVLSIQDVALEASVDRFPVMVESNVSYVVTLPDNDWLTLSGEAYGGTDGQESSTIFNLGLQENEGWLIREGDVSFGNSDYNLSSNLHLLQKAVDIMYASLPLFEYGPEGGSFEFDLDPTKEYTITCGDADWITIFTPEGKPYRRVITLAKSLEKEERTASLVISRGNAKKTLDFVQKGTAPEFSSNVLQFATAGGSQTLIVTGGLDYTLMMPEGVAWCTVDRLETGEYVVTVTTNETESPRECQLMFINQDYGVKEPVTVSQAQKDAFAVSPVSFAFGPEGGRAQVMIHSNIEYDCTIDAPEWITETREATDVDKIFLVAPNATGEPRVGHLTFTALGTEAVVSINQRAAFITASQHSYSVDDQPSEQSFSVTANIPFQVKTVGGGWLSIKDVSDTAVTFSLDENNDWGNHNGKIIVYNEEFATGDTITVFQGAKYYLDIEQMQFDLQPQGGTVALKVNSNKEYEYHIKGSPAWISEISPLVFEILPNIDDQAREVQIVFEQNGHTKSVSITQDAPLLVITPERLDYTSDGGENTFRVTANIDCAVSQPSEEWGVCKATGVDSYTVTVGQNNTPQMRSCTVDISNDHFDIHRQLEIVQAQLDVFELSATQYDVLPKGGELLIDLNTNIDYSYTVDSNWVTDKGNLEFSVMKNATDKERICTVEILAGGRTYYVTITQAAPYLTVDKLWLDFPVDGGTIPFAISSNIDYDVLMPDEEWISYSFDGICTYEIFVPANTGSGARQCIIRIVGADFDLSENVNIGQEKMDFFDLSTTEFSVDPKEHMVQVELRTNMEYTVSVVGEWITDLGDLRFRIDKNDTDQIREGRIVFSAGEITCSVAVSQIAPYLNIDSNQLDFTFDGGDASFTIEANIEYEVSIPEEEWIVCVPSSDGSYSVQVEENDWDHARESIITISALDFDLSKEVVVTQESGDIFEIAQTQYAFDPEGGVFDIAVHTNQEYTYQIDQEWLTEDGELHFLVPVNTSDQARECVVTFLVGEDEYTVTVTQAAPFLRIDVDSPVEIDQPGGSFEVMVSSNVPFDIRMPSVDWISVGEGSEEGVYVFTVDEYTAYRTRTCLIEFVAEDYGLSESVKVSQVGLPEPFSVPQKEYFMGPCGGELEVIHTKCSDVEVSIYGSPWIRELPDKGNDTLLVFSLDTLFTNNVREAVASVTGEGRTSTVYIFQNPPMMILDEDSKSFKPGKGTATIGYRANFTPNFYCEDDWISCSVNEATQKLVFTVQANDTGLERTTVVDVGVREIGFTKPVTIIQAPNSMLRVTPETYRCPGTGAEFYVIVEANIEYNYECMATWLKCEPTEEENVFKITVQENPAINNRMSSVSFTGSGQVAYVRITQEGKRNPDYYYSEDYSGNGKITQLQQASVGSGIPLVIMGDAYTDRLIADGTFDAMVSKAVETFFAIEPFTSFRNMFNVYKIDLVSANEVYADDAVTALSTHFVSGARVAGDNNTVYQIASNAVDPVAMKNVLVIVIMNIEQYGGTTYIRPYANSGVDYGVGQCIVYLPLCTSDEQFIGVLQHEAGGHGFGKLDDEYAYKSQGEVPQAFIDDTRTLQALGFYKNVDFTPDPEQVLWAAFLQDERYQYDGLGVFEGACSYYTGAYRSTETSMMYHNEGPFNAPSREAIYYRLNKLAYGHTWVYDREAFVEYDAINRRTSPRSSQTGTRGHSSVESQLPPLPRPVLEKQ